jgi:hypothetical protein
MGTAERYATLLNNNGWAVLNSELDSSDDALLSEAQEYWVSPGCRSAVQNRWGYMSILNGPTYNQDQTVNIAPVFQFALDPTFKQLQLIAPPPPLSPPARPY